MNSLVIYRTEARKLLTLGIPLIGSNLAQFAIGLTDAVMLGWYDVSALAAVTLAGSFYFNKLPLTLPEAQLSKHFRSGLWLSMAGLLMEKTRQLSFLLRLTFAEYSMPKR